MSLTVFFPIEVLAATLYVSQSGDGSGGLSWPTAFHQIGAALLSAASGDSIWIQAGTYNETLSLKSGVSLYGGFAGNESAEEFAARDPETWVATIDAKGTGSRVMEFVSVDSVHIDGLTLTGGSGVRGGGVYLLDSTEIRIERCRISRNTAVSDNAESVFGGGIYSEHSEFKLLDGEVSHNEVDGEGCGVFLFGATCEITNSLIQSNQGREGRFGDHGGGIWATLSNLKVRNTSILGNSVGGTGGGILINVGDTEIRDSTISGNIGDLDAGGIYCLSNAEKQFEIPISSVAISNCVIDGNRAHGFYPGGGGITCIGPTTISDCTVTNNTGGFNGGGIFAESVPVQITRCLVEGNRATEGGGIYVATSSDGSVISSCIVRGNVAERSGGGIHASGSGLFVVDCSITDNKALGDLNDGGGGIYCRHLRNAKNCVISGNEATLDGGGVFAWGRANLENCLIYENSAGMRGGGYAFFNWDPLILNCVFTNNVAESRGNELLVVGTSINRPGQNSRVVNSIFWNESPEEMFYLIESDPNFRHCDIRGGWPGEGNIDADPLFVDADNGDFRLLLGSPCIDSGSTEGPAEDIEGSLRPVDVLGTGTEGAGAYDMGAYEFQLPHGDLNSNGYFDPLDLFIFQEDWMKATQ